jgi:hypothetical protein
MTATGGGFLLRTKPILTSAADDNMYRKWDFSHKAFLLQLIEN